MRIKRLVAIAAATVSLSAPSIFPASAHPDVVVMFTGTAGLSAGLWAPGAGPSVTAHWWFSSGPLSLTSVSGSGIVTGFCGQSVGAGIATMTGTTTHSGFVEWFSAGTVLVLTGTTSDGGRVFGTVSARSASSLGPGGCVLYPERQFEVVGSLQIVP